MKKLKFLVPIIIGIIIFFFLYGYRLDELKINLNINTIFTNLTFENYLIIILSLAFVIITFFIWFFCGRDKKVIETIEFYPPEDLNSLEVGYFYKGKANSKDVISLLISLANEGYIKIDELEGNGFFSKSDFEFTKLKDYDGHKYHEKLFMRGLFYLARKDNKIKASELYDRFYTTIEHILYDINDSKYSPKVHEGNSSIKKVLIVIMIMALYFLNSYFTVIPSMSIGASVFSIIISFCGFLMLFGLWNHDYIKVRLVGLTAGSALGLGVIIGTILPILIQNSTSLFCYIIGLLSCIILFIFYKIINKRNKMSNEIYRKIIGFKNFLETAEKENLEELVNENPTYFYNILPYTYVLDLSDKWIKKFEIINLQAPEWYNCDSFDMEKFGSFVDDLFVQSNKMMTSYSTGKEFESENEKIYSTTNDSFRGFSGGGRSGKGSGGGGGSSW